MSEAKFVLTLRTGPEEGKVFELDQETIILGRDVTNDIILSDAEVSRRHSRLTLSPQGYVLEDLGSTNGTFVNSERLSGPYLLIPGDQIGLSQKLVLSYDLVTVEGVETVAIEAAAAPVAEPGIEEEIQPPEAAPVDPGALAPAAEVVVPDMAEPAAAGEEPARAEQPDAAQPAPESEKPAKVEEDAPTEKRRTNRWVIAGIGCSALVIIGTVVFWLMDKYYADLLYAPLYSLLRLLGFE